MKKQFIPGTGLEVSKIIYGCMTLGSKIGRETLTDAELKKEAVKTVNTALEEGINIFDHADIYSRGNSEKIFSAVLDEQPDLRNKIVLQSKCGIRFPGDPDEKAPARYDFSHDHIIKAVEGSLQRLKTDYLDILLLHRPDPLVEPEEVAKAFDELKHSGKVRYFGVSNHTGLQIDLLKKYVDEPIVVNQMEINLLHCDLINSGIITNQRNPELQVRGEGTLEYCRIEGISVQAWSPLAKGILSGKDLSDQNEKTKNAAKVVAEIAGEQNVAAEAILIAWLLRHPAKIHPVIGTRNINRIKAACRGEVIHLSREDWYRLFIAGRGDGVP